MKKIDESINEFYLQYINSLDKIYENSLTSIFKKCKEYKEQINSETQKIRKSVKSNMEKLLIENADIINKCDQQLKNVKSNFQKLSDPIQKIKELSKPSKVEEAKQLSEIRDLKLSCITDNPPWDQLKEKTRNLQSSANNNKQAVEVLFQHLEDEVKRKQSKIESFEQSLDETSNDLNKKDKRLDKLNCTGDYADRDKRKDGVLNREQIKSKIADLIKSNQKFNKDIEKYEQQLNECILSKQELNSLEFQLQAKKDKIQEMEDNHIKVRAMLEAKYKEFRVIEDKIKMMDVCTLEYKNCNIIVRKNDLTEELSEAIVNPANEQLMHEGGAARAIADKGGNIIWEESKQYTKKNGNLQTGQATMTSAGNLPCKYVIHAVGPRYNKNLPDNSLAHAQMKMVTNCIMEIVKKENIDSVSISAISTGIFGFPVSKAASIIGNTVKSFIDSNSSEMRGKTIVFCNFDDPTTDVFSKVISNCFSPKVQEDRDEEEDNNEESKQVESDSKECTDSIQICKNCKRGITKKKHQAKGMHLNICYKCYKKKKEKKMKEKKEKDEESEEVKEPLPKRKRRKHSSEKESDKSQKVVKNKNVDRNENEDSSDMQENRKRRDKKLKNKRKNKYTDSEENSN